MIKLIEDISAILWWAVEQFSALFIPNETYKDGKIIKPCSVCWWYRGVLLGWVIGIVMGIATQL